MSNIEKDLISEDKFTTNSVDGSQNKTNSTVTKVTGPAAVSQDSRNMGLFTWLGCLFTGFFVPLILFLVKKDDDYVQEQAKEALNLCISMLITYIGLWIVTIVLGFIFAPLAIIPLFAMGILGFGFLAFCVMGAVKCSSGDHFKVPFNIRLIK